MFQTSSSAIVSVTLKFLQDNSYIYKEHLCYPDHLKIQTCNKLKKKTNAYYWKIKDHFEYR